MLRSKTNSTLRCAGYLSESALFNLFFIFNDPKITQTVF